MVEIVPFTLGPVMTNAYLLGDEATGAAVVIDPADEGETIVATAVKRGWQINSLWMTHAHFDHIAGAGEVANRLNPPPSIALHPDDYPLWHVQGGAALFGFQIDPLPEPTVELHHGMLMHLGNVPIEVRHAPGHTRGHVIFYCSTSGIAFCGDVIFNGSIGRTDLPGGSYATLINSIHRQVLTLPDSTRLYSGHGPLTTVREERRHNPFLNGTWTTDIGDG